MATEIPDQIGRYRILRPLRSGGMAQLYLGTAAGPAGFEKEVVIKCIRARSVHDRQFESMFIDEARIAARLRHGNIVSIFDFGISEGRYFIAMEYVDGVDLARVLRRAEASSRPFPQAFAIHVAKEVARGLEHAHTARDTEGRPLNIVHRDISPSNILLTSDGEVKVVDFGIAKAEQRITQTTHDLVKGKLQYLSPEQALGTRLDGRSDIFSLGVVLFRMIAGHLPLAGLPQGRVLEHLARKQEMPDLSEVVPDVDPKLAAIVAQALAYSAEDRWSSTGELGDALSAHLNASDPDFTPRRLAKYLRAEFPPKRGVADRMKAQLAAFAKPPTGPTDGSRTPDVGVDDAELGRSETLPGVGGPGVGVPVVAPDAGDAGDEAGAARATEPPSDHGAQPMPPLAARLGAGSGAATEEPSVPTYLGEASSIGSLRDKAFPSRAPLFVAIALMGGIAGGVVLWMSASDDAPHVSPDDDRRAGADDGRHDDDDGESPGARATSAASADPDEVRTGKPAILSGSATASSTALAPPPTAAATVAPATAVAGKGSKGKKGPTVKRKALAGKKTGPLAKGPGKLLVRVDPWATVYVDGKLVGTAPMPAISLSPGKHSVRLVNAHLGRNETRTVIVTSGNTTMLSRSWR